MVDIAVLGIAVESGEVERGSRNLDKLSGSAKRAEMTARGVTTAMHTNTAAVRANNMALQANAQMARMASMQQRLLVFQLNDVFVSLASGMNPMMVAIQQGSQIGQIYGPGEGGIGRAFRETGKLITGVLTKFPLLTAAVVASGAAFAGMAYEINSASDVTVSYGDVALATFQVVRDAIYDKLQPAINAIAPWVATAWDAVVASTKFVGNSIIGTFDVAFSSVRDLWRQIPNILGDVAITTANNVLAGVEKMVNGAIGLINDAIDAANKLPGIDIDKLGTAKFDPFENQFSGSIASAMDIVSGNAQRARGTDYFGQFFSAISARSIANAQSRQSEDMDGATDKIGKALDLTKGLVAANDNLGQAGQFVQGVFTDLFSAARKGGDAFSQTLSRIADRLADVVFQAALFGSGPLGSLFGGGIFGGLFGGGAAAGIGSIGASVGTGIPLYEQGTPFVPRDGLAYLHRGERVVPANQNSGMAGETKVEIHNYSKQPARVERGGRGPDGRELIRVVVGEMISGGEFDKPLGARMGVQPVRGRFG